MKTIKGDLIKLADRGEFSVIVHGCNCFNTMGAGIALSLKKKWPAVYAADNMTREGDKAKLGKFSSALIKTVSGDNLLVINAYTQFSFSRNKDVDYEAIATVFKEISHMYGHQAIGIPAIGCGLAGGDWNIVEKLIDAYPFSGLTYVEYQP